MITGTWGIGMTTLKILYQEHQQYRNRWSSTNCGFDLVKYKGTTVYLDQHATVDYLAFFDTEFVSLQAFTHQATLHPLSLITHPQAILVKSRQRAGPRRARKVWLPRPAWWDNGWRESKEACNSGMFAWYVTAVDLDNPWLDYFINDDQDWTKHMWWKDTKWKEEYDKYVREQSQAPTTFKNPPDSVGIGPFMLRQRNIRVDKTNLQLTWFYKSVWYWGGNNITLSKICDPCLDIPVT